jgi:ADP-heptose:LPS heptosyltransferase
VPGSVLIHPGSDAKTAFKRWPVDRFISIAEELLSKGHTVSAIVGPDELDLAAPFERLVGHSGFTLHKNISFAQALRVIAGHETFLNSDSGLGHVAAALGRRTITIFGPEDPAVARPYSTRAVTISSKEVLSCMPCMRRSGKWGCGQVRCMESVTRDQVLAEIQMGK